MTSMSSSTMSDLRTRIKAAIAKADQDWCSDNDLYADMADAVIRELNRDYVLVPKGHTIARIRSAEKLGLTGDGA